MAPARPGKGDLARRAKSSEWSVWALCEVPSEILIRTLHTAICKRPLWPAVADQPSIGSLFE